MLVTRGDTIIEFNEEELARLQVIMLIFLGKEKSKAYEDSGFLGECEDLALKIADI